MKEAINKGLKFLAKDQEKDGSFMCLVSKKLDDYRQANTVPAIVPVNIVLSSLINIDSETSKNIKKKAADFLLSEKSEYWSFNYWFRNSDWYKIEPYPDDVDDTFCALAALYEYNPALFDGEVMAKIVTMLTSAEKKEGGPYDMWLVPPEGRKTWNDLDLVVNSNVAFFLSLQDISLPKVNAFIEKSINDEDYEFPYNKIYPGIYFISRFYKGKQKEKMIDLILSNQEKDGKWENPLRTALAISSLINLSGNKYYGYLEKGINYLNKTQKKDGSWKPYSFYFQMKLENKKLYAGSSSITTALCLEAINKFIALESKKERKKDISKKALEIHKKIEKELKRRFSTCGEDLKTEAEKIIKKTLRGDKDKQITLLPYFFKKSLQKNLENGKNISEELLVKLGVANTLGWIAYTIYDDFLDDEGDTKLLSVANAALRESSLIFASILPEESGFAEFSKKTFDIIDNANTWEIKHCRSNKLPDFKNYSQLAEKSIGHSLGPIAILFALGYRENSTEVKNITKFFEHYIIARQLNDDAHDWEDDLKKGHINSVTAEILKNNKNNSKSFETLQRIFWEKIIIDVCQNMLKHVELARTHLKKVDIIENSEIFEEIISSIEKSAKKALKERKETLKFIKNQKDTT